MSADIKASGCAGYHAFGEEGSEYGSFQVFWRDLDPEIVDDDGEPYAEGWYWWACFPGCLPDGDPSGPFDSSQEAWNSAMDD